MAAIWNLTTARLYCRQNWVIWDKNGSGLKSCYYKVILLTELSYLWQKWQQFEILLLLGFIANRIESLGEKMAVVGNLNTTRLYCKQNWVIWVKNGSSLFNTTKSFSHFGEKWQQFDILPLKGHITYWNRSFGTLMVATKNLNGTMPYCRLN